MTSPQPYTYQSYPTKTGRDTALTFLGVIFLVVFISVVVVVVISIALDSMECLTYSGIWDYSQGVFPVCKDVDW